MSDIDRKYRVLPYEAEGRIRYIFQHAKTYEPSVAMSIYEQYYSLNKGSHKSVKDVLDKLVYFFSWADGEGLDIESMLLRGYTPTPIQVRSFIHWLNQRVSYTGKQANNISAQTYNKVVEACSAMFVWFVMFYGAFEGRGNQPQVDRERVTNIVTKLFNKNKKRIRQKRFAEDLTEEEIETIEAYLKPENRVDADKSSALRDYLIWRLAIEFGFRAGEILALRLKDLPHGRKQDISIVRIEERGKDYYDPRGAQSPRPKTLSRDLGFALKDSPIPRLISDYVSECRCKVVMRHGKKMKMPILDHVFLIIGHRQKNGQPLSTSGMQRIAERISEKVGFDFHWHLVRHAFFNRAYAAVTSETNHEAKMLDLVYWGGWADEKSLTLYINRARRHRAEKALMFWQEGGFEWDALK